MHIREANESDIDALVEMGRAFFAYSAFSAKSSFDAASVEATLLGAMRTGCVLVCERDGVVIGGIAGVLAPVWFNMHELAAVEMAWWVAPEFRKTFAAIRLYHAFEAWAVDKGASVVVMSDLVINGTPPEAKLFEKLGFAATERSHMKRV